jgi:ABC-type nitrate/sulfonate/bicarbonate transport system substrate-binding protein
MFSFREFRSPRVSCGPCLRMLLVRAFSLLLLGCVAGAVYGEPIRLGWQTPWATQGQLVMGLKHTNIPELVDVDIEFVGFSYGAPLNQAALAGQVDILLTADQPAIALLSRSEDFKVVSRMMYNRTCLYVPENSPIQSLMDLEGKSVAGPVGAAAERTTLRALQEAGLELDTIRFGNIDMGGQSALVAAGANEGRWSQFDALYGFDPLPAVFEARGRARMIQCGRVVSVVVASRDMLENRVGELERFLRGFYLSWYQYARNPEKMNELFLIDSNLEFTHKALEIAASVEPNRRAEELSGIRLTFNDQDFETFDQASSFLMNKGVISDPVDIRRPPYLDLRPLLKMLEQPGTADLAESIKVVEE